jgi:AAA domain
MLRRVDQSKIPDGCSIQGDSIFDSAGKRMGPIPYKEYESQEAFSEELKANDPSKPHLKLWSEFDTEIFPEARWKVGSLLPYEGVAIIASPSGEGKTWVAMDMARSIANGENFLEHPDFKCEEGAVMYIDQEMSKSELQRRGRLLRLHNTKHPIYLYGCDNLDLSKKESVDELVRVAKETNVKAVFVDTLRAIAGGLKEDKAEDVRAFMDKFMAFKNKGVVVVFLDHCRKPNQAEGKVPKKEQVLGSQDKVASVEVLIMIKSDEDTGEIHVYQIKCRNASEYKPFKIEMKDTVIDGACRPTEVKLMYAGLVEEKEYKVDKARDMIVDLLSDGGKPTKEIIDFLTLVKKIGKKNAEVALRLLVKEGKLKAERRGKSNFHQINTEYEHKTTTDIDKEFDDF